MNGLKTNTKDFSSWTGSIFTSFPNSIQFLFCLDSFSFVCFTVDLQFCVSFWYTEKWFNLSLAHALSIYTHIYYINYIYNIYNRNIHKHEYIIYIFPCSFPLWFIIGYWMRFPMLYSRSILFIYFTYSGGDSHIVVSDSLWPHGLKPARLLCPWDSPVKNIGVGCHFVSINHKFLMYPSPLLW